MSTIPPADLRATMLAVLARAKDDCDAAFADYWAAPTPENAAILRLAMVAFSAALDRVLACDAPPAPAAS